MIILEQFFPGKELMLVMDGPTILEVTILQEQALV